MLSEEGRALYGALTYIASEWFRSMRDNPYGLSVGLVLRRIGAFLLDILLIGTFTGFIFSKNTYSLLFVVLRILSLDFSALGSLYETILPFVPLIYLSLLYFTLFEGYRGQTPGKYFFSLRVEKIDGSKPTLIDITIRNLGKALVPHLDLVVGLFFLRRRGYLRFFDYYTETRVVRAVR